MDLTSFGIASVAGITVICYLVAAIVKATKLDNKWIPIIVGISGGILGYIGRNIIHDFPATDAITSIAVGVVSGFAATGVNQVFKQLGSTTSTESEV